MNQYITCGSDADCGDNLVECFDFLCVNLTPSCADDIDCGGVATCLQAGACLLTTCTDGTTTCAGDGDCPDGESCGICAAGSENENAACDADPDCGSHCMNLTPTCVDDTSCGGLIEQPGACLLTTCTDGTTTCAGDVDCPEGTTCGICAEGSENENGECDADADCGEQQCVPGSCGNGDPCSSDEECGGVTECTGGTCAFDSSVDCTTDEDCAGLIACSDGVCEHGGGPCDDDLDCGGVTDCTAHCVNRRVSCSEDVDCDSVCSNQRCLHPGNGQPTDVACLENDDCAAVDECNTYAVNGGDLNLCTNLKAPCTSDGDCNTTCREYPVGGPSTCGGYQSVIPCTDDTPCEATTECQQGICVNLTAACRSDINCNNATCEAPNRFPLGLICETDQRCAVNNDCDDGRGNTGRCEGGICVYDAHCRSDECRRYGGTWACSRSCDEQACPNSTNDFPSGFDCVAGTGGAVCWPREGAKPPGRCNGSDFRCFKDSDCSAKTECRDRDPFVPFSPSADESAWLTEYAGEGAKFAVATLSGVTAATGADLLPPLVIQIGGEAPFFPLRTVEDSALELELYVIGRERYRPVNYASTEVVIDQFFEGGSFDDWYARRLAQSLADATEPTFLVEYADAIDLSLVDHVLGRPANVAQVGADRWFLTKLRARLAPGDVGQDLRLAPSGDQRFVIRAVASGAASEAALGGFGVLLAIGWGAWRVRRRR
jgi:hypothetical protein